MGSVRAEPWEAEASEDLEFVVIWCCAKEFGERRCHVKHRSGEAVDEIDGAAKA